MALALLLAQLHLPAANGVHVWIQGIALKDLVKMSQAVSQGVRILLSVMIILMLLVYLLAQISR
jgi:hypothetical protein